MYVLWRILFAQLPVLYLLDASAILLDLLLSTCLLCTAASVYHAVLAVRDDGWCFLFVE